MQIIPRLLVALAIVTTALWAPQPRAAQMEKRVALVIGNAGYQAGALQTPANDAGLVAQTLQAAGFDVMGARDLDGDTLRRTFRDYLDKVASAGPGTVSFIYLAGYGLQFDGDNYFVPVDARIAAAADVPSEALRVSDYTKRLAGLPLVASFLVFDGARPNPFAASGDPLAGGLALVDPDPNSLIAFNATPGSAAPVEPGPYGAYAKALAEMIREGGLPVVELFDRVRLRVSDTTKGAELPWDVSKINAPFVFFERAADAPPPAAPVAQSRELSAEPLRALGPRDGYAAALHRDTLQDYDDFLGAYPSDPMAPRIRAIVALRREEITWRRTCSVGTPDAYWSYLARYPHGPHSANARWRLARFSAAVEPPPSYAMIAYDVPPPPPAEIVYIDRPVVLFDDPVYGFAPPPPPPIVFLPPLPPQFVVLAPPPPPIALFALPDPPFVPVADWVNPPPYVAPPPNNIIFNNIHNETIINTTTNSQIVNPPGAQPGVGAVVGAAAVGAAAGAVAARVALPPSVAQKATLIQSQKPHEPAPQPGVPGAHLPAPPSNAPALGHALPGADGHALPPVPGKPAQHEPAGVPPTHPPAAAAHEPPGHALPGAEGHGLLPAPTKPAQHEPAGVPPTRPPAAAAHEPPGHALPGAEGHGLPPAPTKPVAPHEPAGAPPAHPPAAATHEPPGHALPGAEGHGLPPAPSKPAPHEPAGAPPAHPQAGGAPVHAPEQARPGKPPAKPAPEHSPHGALPNRSQHGQMQRPATAARVAPAHPPAAQPAWQPPRQAQIQRAPPPAHVAPAPPAAAQVARPPAQHPPQPVAQHPPQPVAQHPPQAPQQKPACGRPGTPPCR